MLTSDRINLGAYSVTINDYNCSVTVAQFFYHVQNLRNNNVMLQSLTE